VQFGGSRVGFRALNPTPEPSPDPTPRPDVSVVVPTFREAENLPLLVPRIAAALAEAGLTGEILVVDDDSADGTVEVCERLAADHPVRLLVRKGERGLSGAVVHGLRAARGETLVVMDADLSHPPESIPALVAAVAPGRAEFALGSRYVAGGRTEEGWGLFRWVNSKVATVLARPLTGASDPMSGFFALRRERFEAAAPLNPVGYKIGLELIVKCRCSAVEELPIFFRDRRHGASKLTLKEQFDYLRHLRRLYEFKLGRVARPLQFVLVGSTGMVVDLALFAALLHLLPLAAARALAIWGAMTWNFLLNRRATFSYARVHAPTPQYVKFCAACLVGALVNWAVSIGLCARFAFFARWKLLAAMLGVVAGTVFNYLASSRLVFRRAP